MANTIGTAVLELTTDDSKLRAGLRGAEVPIAPQWD